MDDRRKLVIAIQEFDKKAEKGKQKRSIYTVLFYWLVNTALLCAVFEGLTGELNVSDFWGIAFAAAIISVISFIANSIIFWQLVEKSKTDSETLKVMEKRLAEYDKEHNIEKKFVVEDFLKNKSM